MMFSVACEEDTINEDAIFNPINRRVSVDQKLDEVADLTKRSVPHLDTLMASISANAHIPCQSNAKKRDTIRKKTERFEVKKAKHWFAIEHVRDTLRFRSRITALSQISDVIRVLGSEGVKFVKIDLDKLSLAKQAGWRCAAIDFRLPQTDQIIEYYLSFDAMIDLNERILHSVYERWRDKTELELINDIQLYRTDMQHSRECYSGAWFKQVSDLYRNRSYVDPRNYSTYSTMSPTVRNAPYSEAMSFLELFCDAEIASLKRLI